MVLPSMLFTRFEGKVGYITYFELKMCALVFVLLCMTGTRTCGPSVTFSATEVQNESISFEFCSFPCHQKGKKVKV